jgi:polyhydroxyalkanoate synthesis regulator phasin
MSDEKSKVTDKASEIAKNIWLAGVGAYGRAVDEAQDSIKKATPQPPKLFRELVKAGAQLEEEATEARATAKSSVEQRIARVRENFHMQRPARVEDLKSLHKKVDKLTRKVDALTRLISEQSAPVKKSPVRKKASAKAAPAKKAPAKKKAATRRRKA